MSSMLERLPSRPDLFGWVETVFPGAHVAPGPHGIRIEEHLGDGTYVVRAELPGVDPDKDVEITVDDGLLTLRAERIEQTTEKRRGEFRYGTLGHAVRLPAGAQDEKAAAEYTDGVLTILVPVPEAKTGTRAIPVQQV